MKHLKPVVLAVFALAVSALLVIAGCASSAPAPAATTAPAAKAAEPTKPAAAPAATTAPAAGAATTAPAAASKVNIKIGVIAPMTGDVKTFGEDSKNAFDIAMEEANSAGKVQITPVYADDKNDATEGVNAATKLINQDKVKVIVGSVSSKVTIAISEVAQANKVVQMTGLSTNEKVTVDNGKRKDFIFRACFIDPFQGLVMAKFTTNTIKAKTAAVMYDNGNDYSKGLGTVFKDNFEKFGGKVVNFEAYSTADTDFSSSLTKIASNSPDVLFLPDYYNKVNLLAVGAREKGFKGVLLGGDGWDSSDLDKKAVDGGYYSNHYTAESTAAEVQNWVKKYQAKYKVVPSALATMTYDGMNLLVDAIARAGSDDTTKIKDALQNTKDFKAVSGAISFDKDGNPVKSAVVIQIKDGKEKYVETVAP